MKQIQLSLLLIFALLFNSIAAQETAPTPLSLDPAKVEWFKEAKFGMFIHWGLYSILAGTYNGKTMPDPSLKNGNSWYAEWIHTRLDVPTEEYQNLVHKFNPIGFNADEWIKEAKNAGMRYFIITSKHHDGFALWDSDVSTYNIMRTPYQKDILKELVEACKKYDIKYGFYYSHWQDWEHPGGAWPNWSSINRTDDEFEVYWQEKCLPQVKELLVNFDPDLLWFDTWDEKHHINSERRDELITVIRQNSTKCLINGRISFLNPGENIDFLEMHDNSYPDEILQKPWQTPATMTHSWGWHANDFNWKPSTQMITYLMNNVSKGGNYLLNIGPKPDGTFPTPAIQRLREIGAWTNTHSEAIFKTRPVNIVVDKGIYLTQKRGDDYTILYITSVLNQTEIILPIDHTKIQNCYVVATEMKIDFAQQGDGTKLTIPKSLYQGCNTPVIKLELAIELP